jgi:hypothetical protein
VADEMKTGIKTVDISKLSIPVEFEKIAEYSQDDKRFTRVRITLMHTGLNANGSIFEKDVIEKAIPSLAYIPILGFIEKNSNGEDDFSNHRYVLVKDENGLHREYIGSAYGVILSSDENNAHFEIKDDGSGIEREYLVVDGIMWNFLKGSKIINRDVIKDHSMEIYDDGEESYDGYENEEDNFVFTRFSFRGACILGNDVKYQPAMAGSNIEVLFTINDFVNEVQSELNDKYIEFTRVMSNLKNEKKDENNKSELHSNNGEGGNDDMATDFSQTVMQQFSDIAKIVSDFELTKNRWGEAVPRYYLVDIQDNEVIIVDVENNYQYYGCEFSMDGDKPVVNFETAKRKKITYADYVEGEAPIEGAFNFGTHISDIENAAFTKVSEAEKNVEEANEAKVNAETNYSDLKAEYDEIKPKYEAYEKAESDRIEAETKKAKENVIAQYESHLKDDEKFEKLKGKLDEYSTADDVYSECAIMFAKKNIATNFSTKGKENSNVLGASTGNDSVPEGYVMTKYGLVRTSR